MLPFPRSRKQRARFAEGASHVYVLAEAAEGLRFNHESEKVWFSFTRGSENKLQSHFSVRGSDSLFNIFGL